MYSLIISQNARYDIEELIKVFLMPGEYEIVENGEDVNDKNALKRKIYSELSKLTGKRPEWGILTGVRPAKLTAELISQNGEKETKRILKEDYLLSDEKVDLLIETCNYQSTILGKAPLNSIGLYIGIPFCPTRCEYCSFTSNQKPESEIIRYLDALKREIAFAGKRMHDTGLYPESVYIGGGTPTTLNEYLLDDLLNVVKDNMDLSKLREFTVEAGRPDTITKEKLDVIKSHGIERISINPQSMKQRTLDLIGRKHTPQDILKAFQIAKASKIEIINCDLIAGLNEEIPRDFAETLKEVLSLDPKNITVHTLAVKRASRLIESDPTYNYRQGDIVKEMLLIGENALRSRGYRPYYLYRQKHMAGSFENVGWCKDDTPCIYNIRIMDEHQSILALGAGGISKIYFDCENRLERVPNVSNYEVYIDRLDEMLERKETGFFKEVRNAY